MSDSRLLVKALLNTASLIIQNNLVSLRTSIQCQLPAPASQIFNPLENCCVNYVRMLSLRFQKTILISPFESARDFQSEYVALQPNLSFNKTSLPHFLTFSSNIGFFLSMKVQGFAFNELNVIVRPPASSHVRGCEYFMITTLPVVQYSF